MEVEKGEAAEVVADPDELIVERGMKKPDRRQRHAEEDRNASAHELEEILGMKIYSDYLVKVAENWRENPMVVRELDWHTQLEALKESEEE